MIRRLGCVLVCLVATATAQAIFQNPIPVISQGQRASYRASASFTPVAGDVANITGSASKTVRVTEIELYCTTSGTAAYADVALIKRSAADTSGTSVADTAVPLDSNSAAASASAKHYTAAPTPGAAVGNISNRRIMNGSGTVVATWAIWELGTANAQPVVLRGTAQQLNLNLSAVVATQTCDYTVEWTEE